MADLIINIVLLYLGVGLLFALAFVSVGVARVDATAKGAPIGFRLVILPGAMALWPVLAVKWLRGAGKSDNKEVDHAA